MPSIDRTRGSQNRNRQVALSQDGQVMPAPETIQLTYPEPDIALLTMDLAGRRANLLSRAVFSELEDHLRSLADRHDLAGVVICSGKPNHFCAGADLYEFDQSLRDNGPPPRELIEYGVCVLQQLAQCPQVTVALVEGICLGGGAELASWCDYRIVADTKKTCVGFPETGLGILPCWGGTARVPRMVDLEPAVDMLCGAAPLTVPQLAAIGWATQVVPRESLFDAAVRVVRERSGSELHSDDRRRFAGPCGASDEEVSTFGETAPERVRRASRGHHPAAIEVLELILANAAASCEEACRAETTTAERLFGSEANRALLNAFFLADRNKKDLGVEKTVIAPKEIRRLGLIGAGVMGCGIAVSNLSSGCPVVLTDAAADVLQRSGSLILDEVATDDATGQVDQARREQLAKLLIQADGEADLSACDLVLESIVENVEVKRRVLQRLEPLLPPETIVATNTSAIPVNRLAEFLERPERFCGIHFCNPVRQRKLVEVVRGTNTDDATVATAVAYVKRLRKTPIVVNDGPGFVVNRLLFPLFVEAFELIRAGVPLQQIDDAAHRFGFKLGPFELCDMIGIDTSFYAARTLWDLWPDFRERMVVSPILPALIKSGRLGQKCGRGFYLYPEQGSHRLDPELDKLFAPYVRGSETFTNDELLYRLFLPMLLEATRALEEGVVRDPRDIDLALIDGLALERWRGGLMYWADMVGAAAIREALRPLEDIGPRMRPTEMIDEMAKSNRGFYAMRA
jgi:3-hydroxyacyl-CoA dehydrogenase/enoyl-CoA hydratase/3-hydroxybutyryl-CoA epimerase/3-hydroxyacyl-CoA dehydrogenase/enoyl-CoA hydratase/3-hydroxybutyryl-CoA epimerase/enoyl-CoA isomerase